MILVLINTKDSINHDPQNYSTVRGGIISDSARFSVLSKQRLGRWRRCPVWTRIPHGAAKRGSSPLRLSEPKRMGKVWDIDSTDMAFFGKVGRKQSSEQKNQIASVLEQES